MRNFLKQSARKFYRKLPIPVYYKFRIRLLISKHLPIVNKYLLENQAAHPSEKTALLDQYLQYSNLDLNQPILCKTHETPLVSIIIPVYNHIQDTYGCLKSINDVRHKYSYEIIVVDDCSTDETQAVLAKIPGIRVVRNEKNSGFIRSCNKGAQQARGKYVLFLNNDTIVMPNWMDEMVRTFELFPNAGLVGSKLVFPDGKLQEAGGIIWQDGSAWNYGRFQDPNIPEFNYLRRVDYCTGASIMLPADLFRQVGGFDELYVPAYCEDSDLAFKVREAGRDVLYQPLSQLIHIEGLTAGVDLSQGVKANQVINMGKMYKRWKQVLKNHAKNGTNPEFAKEREIKKRILVFDATTPTPDRDAGSLTAFNMIKILLALGYKVTYMPYENFAYLDKYTADLQRIGVECLYTPYTDASNLKTYLEKTGKYFDAVLVFRSYIATVVMDLIKEYCKNAKIIFHPQDLYFLREMRQAEIENSSLLKYNANKIKKYELASVKAADVTFIHSTHEKQILEDELGKVNIAMMPLIMDIENTSVSYANRSGILFLGGFRHAPNVDAVMYFAKEIFPLITKQLPTMKFYIIGADPTPEIQKLHSENIEVLGHVPDLRPWMDKVRLSVCPLRYGAGIKGKVGMSMSYGLPCVASTVAVEGMDLISGKQLMVADAPEDFANAVIKVYSDQPLWECLSQRGLEFASQNYSFEAVTVGFKNTLANIGLEKS